MPTVSGVILPTGSHATGRRTLSDVVDELVFPIDDDDKIKAFAADAFRSAVRRMNFKGCWPWELQTEDLTITNGVRTVSILGAMKKPLSMHLLTASGGTENKKLGFIAYDVYAEKYSLDYSYEPTAYTIQNFFETGQVIFWPKPDATYYARLNYYRVTPSPKLDNDTIEIPDYAIEAYMAFAWYEFLKRLPSAQRPFDIAVALGASRDAFREISAHVVRTGDRARQVTAWPYGP